MVQLSPIGIPQTQKLVWRTTNKPLSAELLGASIYRNIVNTTSTQLRRDKLSLHCSSLFDQ